MHNVLAGKGLEESMIKMRDKENREKAELALKATMAKEKEQ